MDMNSPLLDKPAPDFETFVRVLKGEQAPQDVILPVGEFKHRYGNRVATLGGVDVDPLARLDEPALRRYIRSILDHCAPGGRCA